MASLPEGYSDERFRETVNEDLHCPICMNVLREPVHCGPNEHYFCKSCITTHLNTSKTCPCCQEKLSVDALKPSRFVTNRLNLLTISCDNANRGCEELVQLETLNDHVKSCGFSPVQCSNEGCSSVLNRKDYDRHVKKECKFRGRDADSAELKKELEEVKTELQETKIKLSKALDYVRHDFVIIGGSGMKNKPLDCVDIFRWSSMTWEMLNPLRMARSRASVFVYNGQVVICGGAVREGTKVVPLNQMEKISLTSPESDATWSQHHITLPVKKSCHKCFVNENQLLIIGGYDDKGGAYADAIHSIRLKSKIKVKVVARLPFSRRFFGAEKFGDKVLIVGGTKTSSFDSCVSNVTEFNVKTNGLQELPPLPYPVTGMATAAWHDKLVVIGGMDEDGDALDTVIMYDVSSGDSTMLPRMREKRGGASAIVTGQAIVVMGGSNETGRLNSVEYFNFSSYKWKELPRMGKARSYASAIVKPKC